LEPFSGSSGHDCLTTIERVEAGLQFAIEGVQLGCARVVSLFEKA
jgi:hypothetical protein